MSFGMSEQWAEYYYIDTKTPPERRLTTALQRAKDQARLSDLLIDTDFEASAYPTCLVRR